VGEAWTKRPEDGEWLAPTPLADGEGASASADAEAAGLRQQWSEIDGAVAAREKIASLIAREEGEEVKIGATLRL
jgi:hypothetical protein